jgi:phosphate transport system substrate-binding protein
MADVFLAVSRGPAGFNKLVVIKQLRAAFVEDRAFRRMFLDEARLAARLNHPNVVQTYEVGDFGGSYFIAMEYLDGQPLHKVLREAARIGAPLDPLVSARIVADALSGLHSAHELRDYGGSPLGIIHRDVSPHNIFVTYDGQVKLVDFGIAKARSNSTDTEVGVLKGKISYMAPEQALGGPTDRRSDIFAMGVVLWELLTGKRLMSGESNVATLHRVVSEPIAPPSLSSNGLDPELDVIAMKALNRDPEARFQTAAAMRDALIEVLSKHNVRHDAVTIRMSTMFETRRAEIAQYIKECMQASNAGAPTYDSIPPPPGLSSRDSEVLRRLPSLRIGPDSGSLSVGLRASSRSVASGTAPITGVLPRSGGGAWTASIVGIAAVLLSAAGLFLWFRQPPLSASTGVAVAPASHADPVPATRVILRLHGSNTIGAELAPLLAEAFLKHGEIADVSRRPGTRAHEDLVVGKENGKPDVAVEIEAEGSSTAFADLANGECDIGMSSRPIRPEEAEALRQKGLGDLSSPASEHVLGLDGIAVIVHPNNPLRALTLTELRGIFTGETRDWSVVGGSSGPIVVYARDDQSGTYDTFKHLVLGSGELVSGAHRFAESDKLSDAVSADAGGIGFIGLVYVRNAKAVAVSDQQAAALFPSTFTVATEDYALSRRLFLYTPVRPKNLKTLEFVNFAMSPEGQKVVKAAGFVDLNVSIRDAEPCTDKCPGQYLRYTSGARRLSLDFRFRTGSTDLDSRALRDFDRLLAFLRPYDSPRIALLGFSDGSGDASQNIELSRVRALKVDEELGARGIHAASVEGFGPEMPVASNAAEQGREKNRRVEVWLEGAH